MNLVEIARKTLEAYFEGDIFECSDDDKKKYSINKACFVTLTKNGNLRGCIGNLKPKAGVALWKNVQENAINAGFKDPRFSPLKKEELSAIKIEVSILTRPEKLEFESEKELLDKLNNKLGVILKKGNLEATFLPQVWEQISSKRAFLEELSLKAGMNADAWRKDGVSFFVYEVQIEGEK